MYQQLTDLAEGLQKNSHRKVSIEMEPIARQSPKEIKNARKNGDDHNCEVLN